MTKSPGDMAATMVANLKEKTGKTLEQWLKLARAGKSAKHGELVKHLKTEHGLTHGYANLIAHKALQSDAGSADAGDLVDAQYGGKKAGLRPLYDELLKIARKLGKDVEVAPKKSYVSLRRNKQFALIQPTTATRLDLGLNLKGVEPEGRLEASGSFNAMCSHRVRITDKKDIDAAVKGWLKRAYENA